MSNVTYKNEKPAYKMVKYEGADTLYEGMPVFYNADYGTATASDVERALRVEKATAANLDHFAGVVDAAYAGRTGPCLIRINVPTARGTKVKIWTDQNCTADSTILCLAPAAYTAKGLGVGGGKPFAKALQTVDRSTTNGTVQAIMYFPNAPQIIAEAAIARGPSPAIWADCPYEAIKANPFLGTIVEDDFKKYATAGYWTEDNTNGSFAQAAADDGGMTYEDGLVTLTTTGADNDAAMIVGGGQTAAAGEFSVDTRALGGRKLWFEARVSVSEIADGDLAIGLCDPEVTDVNLIENDDSQIEENFIGFRVLHADPDGLDAAISEAGTEDQVVEEAQVMVADTPYKVGFVYDPDTDVCTFYVDGVAVGTLSDAGSDAAWPHSVDLSPVFCTKAQGATSSLHVDWVRVAQVSQ